MTVDAGWLKDHVRDIPDFPEPGVVFKDITPLLADPSAFRLCVDALVEEIGGTQATTVDKVLGIEARGFILAAPVAYHLGAGFVPVRKGGKLPCRWRRRSTCSSTAPTSWRSTVTPLTQASGS